VPTHAQTIPELGDRALDVYQYQSPESPLLAQQDTPELPLGSGIYEYSPKSPARAFVYSLILPGFGQWYTGSKIKAAVFLGVEVATWAGWLYYRGQGGDLTDAYEAFADQYWFDSLYWYGLDSSRDETISPWTDETTLDAGYSHRLPFLVDGVDTLADRNGEYYENIGKYDQFIWGWIDRERKATPPAGADTLTYPELLFRSDRRQEYVLMREDANREYDRARVAAIVLIANHVISAFDAALGARRHNRAAERAQRFDVDVKMVSLEETPTPWVSVSYRF
jgi:hypothetical protein